MVQIQPLPIAYILISKSFFIYTQIAWMRWSNVGLWLQGRRRRGAGGARAPPLSKVGGGHKWVCAPPPTFGQSKCSNFTICSYFVVKNTFFFKIFLARFARQLY